MSRCTGCLSRRTFLERSLFSATKLALGAPAFALLSSCGQQPLASGKGLSDVTTVATNSNNLYTFNFTDYPLLQSVGGSVHVTVNATSGNKDLYITRVDTNTVDTVSTICTHAGCTINPYDSTTREYLCPCHGSIFSADGNVINGPTTTPLPSYPATLSTTGVQITIT